MAKKVLGQIKLQVPAGAANPSPPIGPALGQRGLNIMEFCKGFTARTQDMPKGDPCPVVITYYQDKSFTFEIKTPPASFLIKKAAKMSLAKKPGSGSKEPNKVKVGSVTEKQVREVAASKIQDMNCTDIEAAVRIVKGTARSMGLDVKG